MTAEKILAVARGEIGVKESPANSDQVKYVYEYGMSPAPWCCAFVWWVFREAGASELFYGGGKTAYCPSLKSFHKAQAVSGDYKPGDIIFFNFAGKKNAAHVGICESWDGKYITTIDGNTAPNNEANGGAVMRRKRAKKYIVGAYRPAYEEEDTVTYDQWKEHMRQYRQELRDNDCGSWSEKARQFAVDNGIFAGGAPGPDGQPNFMWEDLLTREQCAQVLYAFAQRFGLV